MRVGLVCPYSLDVPGGVQRHVTDLATALRAMGHEVNVLAPAKRTGQLPDFVTPAGSSLGLPYNGSVARLAFGPRSLRRVRQWLDRHRPEVLHLHEPMAPSLSMLALLIADCPIVATTHTAIDHSRALRAVGGMLTPLREKIIARIAVSACARRVQVQHLGAGAVEIPNGVDVRGIAAAAPLPGYPRPGGTIGFVGRFDEPRKGMPILLRALDMLPEVRLLVAGPGDPSTVDHPRADLLGEVDEATKNALLNSVDVYAAPHLGGESFGMVLAEAMAAGRPVVASGLPAFRAVLADGAAGTLVPPRDPAALAAASAALLADPARRATLGAAGRELAAAYDWPVVAAQVAMVYETAIAADPRKAPLWAG
ncbi:glycosyltransferase family 1 protein [Pseudonocardiaceae bacterium YIM PH 21723]|nr:glycosyltransferase family 1 protein [Pseudonocardiaceae bacterium YIM PH 21723]